jgi:cell division protein FtsI (penicillin-binding protein 3)
VAGTVFKEIADRVYASDYTLYRNPVNPEKDKTGTYPYSKGGTLKEFTTICNILKIALVKDGNITEWVSSQATDTSIVVKSKTVTAGIVPSVVGMGAKDAVSILENLGLNVRISGVGKVTSQSLKAGEPFRKGNIIFLNLG